MRIAIVGAGVFGAAAAVELARRGHAVSLHDPGPLPHPDAASTDISKLVRADYGSDRFYRDLVMEALDGWESDPCLRPHYHPDGLVVMGPSLRPGTFEGDSAEALGDAGFSLEILGEHGLRSRTSWVDAGRGYINRRAGWAASGDAVRSLVEAALAAGVRHVREAVRDVDALDADAVVVAAGAWTPALLPELADRIVAVGQPVLHFQPSDPAPFQAPAFLPWCFDIARTGFYGFPATDAGIVKVANHGPGVRTDPMGPRQVGPEWEGRFRAFLRAHLPGLADAPIVGRRLCLYADSFDGDFFIDAVPDRPRVFVAGGGSGHGFKVAPVLGPLVADVVEGRANRWAQRFRWRPLAGRSTEQARFDGSSA